MEKTLKLEDLSPDQLRAQVKLCFKFMEQCLSMLNGEDVKDEAAIRLVDPFGDCGDMELFYACKRIGGAGDLADALATIDKLNKQNQKLKQRLAKKHDELEQLRENNNVGGLRYSLKFDTEKFEKGMKAAAECMKKVGDLYLNPALTNINEETRKRLVEMMNDFVKDLPHALTTAISQKVVSVEKQPLSPRDSFLNELRNYAYGGGRAHDRSYIDRCYIERLISSITLPIASQQFFGIPQPKFDIDHKVYFIENGVVTQSSVKAVEKLVGIGCVGFRYLLKNGKYFTENKLFGSVEDLLQNLKENIRNGE